MLLRVNPIVLLGSMVVIVLSFWLTAGAALEKNVQGAEPEGEIGQAREELARMQREAAIADAEYNNAQFELDRLNQEIAGTVLEREEAQGSLNEAQGALEEQASLMYKNGDYGFMDVLAGAESFSDLASRLGHWTRLLDETTNDVEKWREQVDEHQRVEDQLESDLRERRDDLQEIEAHRDQATEREQAIEDFLGSDTDLQETVEQEKEKLADELKEQRNEVLGSEPAEVEEVPLPAMRQGLPEDKLTELQETLSNVADTTSEVTELRDETSKAAEEAANRAAESTEAPATGATDETDLLAAAKQFAEKQADLEQAQAGLEDSRRELQVNLEEAAATGRAAARPPAVSDDKDGVVGGGDRLYVEGEFSIEPGSSVTLQDADGTRGTVTDGSNAKIVEGSIDTTVTGTPTGVSGGDGQLATDGLEIVDTSGIVSSPEFAIGLDPTGAAGLQYDPMVGTSGSQYAPNFGAAGAQYDPSIRAAGLQYDPSTRAAGSKKPAQAAGPASSLGSALLGEAMNWLGVPYGYGGAGVTCTGLTAAVYEKFGYSLPLSEAGQLGAVGSLNPGPPPPGSIAFWSEDGSGMPTHVGIGAGGGMVVDANIVGGMVKQTPYDIVPGYMGWGFPA